MAIVTDHESEFYANRRDDKGCADHEFEEFLKEHGMCIFCVGLITRQTNGKIEKFHDLYIRHRELFASLDELVVWYSGIA